MTASSAATPWQAPVADAIVRIKAAHARAGAGTPEALQATAAILQSLAAQPALFSFAQFPLPAAGGSGSARYALHADSDQQFALYLNALLPGKTSVPHNHGTWAVIVAVQGEEENRIYAAAPGTGRIAEREVFSVKPGRPALYGPDDIHSIHVRGSEPALLFHLYGRALETLTDRLAFDLATGEQYRYNERHYRPNAG